MKKGIINFIVFLWLVFLAGFLYSKMPMIPTSHFTIWSSLTLLLFVTNLAEPFIPTSGVHRLLQFLVSVFVYILISLLVLSYVPEKAIGPEAEALVCVEEVSGQEYWDGGFWHSTLGESELICAKRKYNLAMPESPGSFKRCEFELVLDASDKAQFVGQLTRLSVEKGNSFVSFITSKVEKRLEDCLLLVWKNHSQEVTQLRFDENFLKQLPDHIRTVCDLSFHNLTWQKLKMQR